MSGTGKLKEIKSSLVGIGTGVGGVRGTAKGYRYIFRYKMTKMF